MHALIRSVLTPRMIFYYYSSKTKTGLGQRIVMLSSE
jgi:hypothetical protein